MPQYKKYTPPRKNKVSKKRAIILFSIGFILLLGLLLVLDRKGVINLPFLSDEKPAPSSNGINYGPPTDQEKTETEQFKEGIGNQTTNPPPNTPSSPSKKKTVTPIMTSWGADSQQAEVRGYVAGVNEEGGTCTLTLTNGSQKVTETKPATPDAQTVSCGLISIARDKLSPGTWTATLSYSSNNAEGVSNSNSLKVE
jgi:hypothetical protein